MVSTKEPVAELRRARLLAFVNRPSQSPTTVSTMTDLSSEDASIDIRRTWYSVG